MGKLVETSVMRYYGNVRRRPGDQFIMADSDFKGMKPVLDHDKKPVVVNGVPKMEESGEEIVPQGIVVIEDGHEDPVFESEADLKKKAAKPSKRVAAKKQPDDLRQGGAFDIHPESGVQVTGQVAPAKPAASSFAAPDVAPAKDDKKSDKKGSGDKSVL